MNKNMLLFSVVALSLALLLASCTKKQAPSMENMTAEQIAERGKAIYIGNCISCHNSNPALDGSVGPSVAGASLELIQTRLLKAEYPQNYKPKRETRVMPAMPYLEKEIPFLAAFLSSTPSNQEAGK